MVFDHQSVVLREGGLDVAHGLRVDLAYGLCHALQGVQFLVERREEGGTHFFRRRRLDDDCKYFV
jgi:hypothetical protein